MDIIASLFINRAEEIGLKPGGSEIVDSLEKLSQGVIIRIFCKELGMDDNFILFFNSPIPDTQKQVLKDAVETYRILSFLSGKKVFVRVRKFFEIEHPPAGRTINARVLVINLGDNQTAKMVLNEKNIDNLLSLFGFDNHGSDLREKVEFLRKVIFHRVSTPPKNFVSLFLSLPDNELQLLLNAMLHKNIATTDMLSAYIYSLDKGSERFLENLSANIRREIKEKMRSQKLSVTYRFVDEVYYIINRNIMICAEQLGVNIKGLEVLRDLKQGYEFFIAENRIITYPVEKRLSDLSQSEGINALFNTLRRKDMVNALSFAEESIIETVFGGFVSSGGISMLKEDRDFALTLNTAERFSSLVKFLRACNDIIHTPRLKEFPFEETVMEKVKDGFGIDIIVDELGFASAVYALKTMPKDWTSRILKSTFRNIYEDVLSGKLRIRGIDNFAVEDCRREFLKTVLILSEEEKI
jgi:hypothetical protein